MKRSIFSLGILLMCCVLLFTGCSATDTTIEYRDGSQTVELDIEARQSVKLTSFSGTFEPGLSQKVAASFKNTGDEGIFHTFTLTNLKHNSASDFTQVLKVYDTSASQELTTANYLGTLAELTQKSSALDTVRLVDYVFMTGEEIADQYPGDLDGAFERKLELTFVMDEAAGNEYQSANGPVQCSFDINLYAVKP